MRLGTVRLIAIPLSFLVTATAILWCAVLPEVSLAGRHYTPQLATRQTTSKWTPDPAVAYDSETLAKRTAPAAPKATQAAAPAVRVRRASSRRTSSVSQIALARSILAAQIRRHPILRGTTVTFGNARGYQAISYYQSGQIIISRTHTASLQRIITHEVWHIIDWRDNGRIDWGENIPR